MNKKIFFKKVKQVKSLTNILKKRSGRDNSGQISVRHQGGRQKRFYRVIDFKRDKRDMEAEVIRIERDPNRNAFIALVKYQDNELRYILYPNKLEIGDKIIASENAEIKIGNALALKNIPIGTLVHNVELYIGKGGQMIKSAGTAAVQVLKGPSKICPINCFTFCNKLLICPIIFAVSQIVLSIFSCFSLLSILP